MMNEHGKSDRPIVPEKSPNQAKDRAAEEMEGRGLAKGNLSQQNAFRTLRRADAPSALEQVRQAAKGKKDARFTTLMHHVYQIKTLTNGLHAIEEGSRPGGGRRDVAALRRELGGKPSGPLP